MSQALYRKYRSKSLDEVVGQEHVTLTLQNALQAGHISHAYLFTGPRGVGKTSIARILAHAVNQLPYDETMNHLDIIEIDAASNRGIEEIRDLREKAALAPTSATYKVYIIDEVHMLTPPAFNALLKTLEEPPSHVIFMLATTEAHKLPDTIISRTQRHSLRPIEADVMVPHLRRIADAEGIAIDDDALMLIARHADGGFRDAISLLDHVRQPETTVTADDVAELIGLPPSDLIDELITCVINANANKALLAAEDLFEKGYQPQKIVDELLTQARLALTSAENGAQLRLLQLMDGSLHVAQSANPKIALELALYKSAYSHETPSKTPPTPHQPAPVTPPPKTAAPKKVKQAPPSTPAKATPNEAKDHPIAKPTHQSASLTWDDVLKRLKGEHNTLYGILRMAESDIDESKRSIRLGFQFPFHMKRAAETKHAAIIQATVKDITNQDYEIRYEKRTMNSTNRSDEDVLATKQAVKSASLDVLTTVRSVFGDAEVLR